MARINDLEQLLQDLEQRLVRLSRVAATASSAAPDTAGRVAEMIAAALGTMADRFRGRAQTVQGDLSQVRDEALQFGNDALRRLAHEVERRPLMTLVVAVGVGALVAGLLLRRS